MSVIEESRQKHVRCEGVLRYICRGRKAVWSLRSEREKEVRISKIASTIGILFCMGAISLTAQNASVRLGGSSLRANGQVAQGFQYTGFCPVELKFGWGVIANAPTAMSYHFVRSDGGHSTNYQNVNMPAPGRSVPVYDDWRLGANTPKFANFSGWVQIIIDSPSPVQGKIPFTIHCR